MTAILVIFIIALVLSLVLSPLLRKFGIRFGAVDEPDELKVHTRSIARCGGMGIFLSFLLTLAVSSFFFKTSVSSLTDFDLEFARR